MKKNYYSPVMEEVEILTASIICGSPENPEGTGDLTPPGKDIVPDAPARRLM